jgi:hypothetical protein
MFSAKCKAQTCLCRQGAKFVLIFFFLLLATCYLLLTTVFAEPNCDSPGPGDIDFCLQRIESEINDLKPSQ